ncbi:M20 family peptidase [Alteribacter keqinensis]|uniref:M20 family peptidase n=2 Tax=Alteribacter keqinensis TaxID=2483800 RepID=A0A3M7TYQ4_9BACI|nr:M20 family peptidase [Alteribacter keqinensis]
MNRNAQQQEGEVIQLIKAESPTYKKNLVDKCGSLLMKLFENHFMTKSRLYPQEHRGDHFRVNIGTGWKRILILVHFDTVWDEGRLTTYKKDGRLYGPGAIDMKGGIIQAMWAVKALFELGGMDDKEIVFLCTSDEEVGSQTSRNIIEREARLSDAVLVMEPPVSGSGAIKTSRSGVGFYEYSILGKSSHAGSNHHEGRSAIKELAHQVLYLESLTDYMKGTTVNVGVVNGGTRLNVVPEFSRAHIDFRVKTSEEAGRIMSIAGFPTPVLDGTSIFVTGGLNRPPMERNEKGVLLFEKVKAAGKKVGLEIEEAHAGGGSDGNFTAALGIPTIDGLGSVGDGAHAEHEHLLLKELPVRTAMLAHFIEDL